MAKQKTLDALLRQKQELNQQIKQARQAEKRRAQQQRKRRMEIAGRYVLEQHERAGTMDQLHRELDGYLTQDAERKLFDLPQRKQAHRKSPPAAAPEQKTTGREAQGDPSG